MITTYAQLLPPAWAPPTPPTPARWPANSGWNDLHEHVTIGTRESAAV